MEYRRLGRTGLIVSAVGFGTNELRLVPEKQAIDALLRGFDLGVNIIHTAPDYEGAEEIVAKAVACAGRKIIVASNGYDVQYNATGRVHHFEDLFEATCARLRTDRLELYGIAAVDDREAFQENMWGKNGMVEFLLRMKEQGRIGSMFCTNHGEPRHMRKLIESGVFDAMMISLNPLGYHLLTLHPPPGRHFEDASANWREIVPLCRKHDIGVMAMMPLAGGLLVNSRAFPRRQPSGTLSSQLTASDVLRSILEDKNIACVVPGTASLDEAEENARAGHHPIEVPAETRSALAQRVTELHRSLCSRCGACEDLCSQRLPVSWLFRAGEMAMQPAEAFETWSDVEYFQLHPSLAPSCASCASVTCACPYGIDIPRSLIEVHQSMVVLLERGLIAPPPSDLTANRGDATFGARVIRLDIPESMHPGQAYICRLQLENIGTIGWHPEGENGAVVMRVFLDGAEITTASFRQVVHPRGRGHIVFELDAPRRDRRVDLRLQMLVAQQGPDENAGFEVFRGRIPVNCQARIADNVTPMNCQPPQNPSNSAPAMEGPPPQTAPAIPQPGVAELVGAGLQHHQAGRLADAEAHYRRILDIVPGHADALHLLGGLAYQTGRLEAAIELIGRAIEHNGNDPSYHSSLGLVLHTLNRLDEAVASYDRALLLNPDYAIALLNRGLVLEALQRFDEALESYDRALAIEPNFAEAWLNRGNSLQQLGRLAEALESYDRALAVGPDLAEAHYSRAEVLHSLERLDEAAASYDRALALNPDFSRFITGQVSNIAKRPLKRPEKRLEFSVGWLAHNLPAAWSEKEAYYVYVNLENRGDRPWLASHPQALAITLDVRIQGQIVTKLPLPKDVTPGEHVTFNFWLDLPEGTGDWDLALSLVAQDCIWTGAKESPPLLATIQRVASASPSYQTVTLMRTSNPAFYAPSHSVPRSRSGRPYPLLIRNATGARIYDPENNEWIDYVMGWGSALLGYAHPEISRAIADHLHSGAVLSLPHELEAEVTRRLVELIPCAEMVLFGKNGSDACNAAVRAARLATGRRVVLFSGYHGWQEPFADVFEPALAPPCGSKEVFRFGLGDLDALRKLVTEHSGEIAAVMLEPAAQVEGVDGPVRDADPDHLRKVAEICHSENAILIFDEIMTGFRFRCGSVQRATGVLPDLACFGKALSSGMPLSVLVGRRDVLAPVLPQMFYHPTFKGEAYSFAAALAALNIYQQEDVPSRIHTFGNHLIDGVNGISEELGIDGQMVGLPYRMVYKFNESQEGRRAYLRTLLQQELLQRRVLTFRGFMLPSLAHGEQELEETLKSFRAALTRVQQAATEESFVSSLEIPLVV